MSVGRSDRATGAEATVTSKGQITLPKSIRQRLGIQTGSRIRFLVDTRGRLQGEPVLYDLEDLWVIAEQGPRSKRTMTAADMNAAKARRKW
jgi:antitoxin PrlF